MGLCESREHISSDRPGQFSHLLPGIRGLGKEVLSDSKSEEKSASLG